MTLPIKTQITNLTAKALKVGVHQGAIEDLFDSNDNPKSVVAGLRQMIENAKNAPAAEAAIVVNVDAKPAKAKAAKSTKAAKPAPKSKAPKKAKAAKAAATVIAGAIVVMLKGKRADQMDVKNTTLNALKFAEAQEKKPVKSEDIKAALVANGVDMDDVKLRMSIGNLARDGRIERVGHGTYKSLV